MSQAAGTVRCPLCGRRTTWRENPYRPFCSQRCRLADLERWLKGRYVVAGDAEAGAAPPPDPDLTDGQPGPELREKT